MREGLDVSSWQGVISWPDVAAAGKTFAVIRSGDGAYLDPYFERNIEGALAAGLDVSIYHYMRFSLSGERQAEICGNRRRIAIMEGMPQAARLWLDFEDTNQARIPAGRRSEADGLLDTLGDGLNLGVYTGTWWWSPYMGYYPRAGELPLWIGQYPVMNSVHSDPTAAGLSPVLPPEWGDWAMWQYSSTGSVPGIDGNVDLNIAQGGDDMAMTDEEIQAAVRRALPGTEEGLADRIREMIRTEIAGTQQLFDITRYELLIRRLTEAGDKLAGR